jgi:hypothetical protein
MKLPGNYPLFAPFLWDARVDYARRIDYAN